MFDIVSGALRVSLVTFVLCGFAYPSAVTVLGQLLAPFQAHGSLATNADGVVLGSRLIGQNWTDPKWNQALLQTNAQGVQTPVSVGQFQQNLMKNPIYGYQNTQGARDQAYSTAQTILQTFGKVAS